MSRALLYIVGSCAGLFVLYKAVTPSEEEMRKKLNIPRENMRDISKKNQLLIEQLKGGAGVKTTDDKKSDK